MLNSLYSLFQAGEMEGREVTVLCGHKLGAREVEKATGVPTFYIEADFFDDRDYSQEALRTRIESISQVIKMRKAAREQGAA